ncbi:MAG: hypothetical protein P8184_09165 [Calditrichia bacterium]
MNDQNKNPESNSDSISPESTNPAEAYPEIGQEEQMDAAERERLLQEGWLPPMPREALPEPTYWPITLALGLMFLLWGIVTSTIFSAVGLVITVVAVRGWVHDIRMDHKKQSVEEYE